MRTGKIQRNIMKHHVHQRINWVLSPVIIAELAVVVVIAGVGMAFAVTQTNISTNYAPWEGTASIQESQHFTVANYSLCNNLALNQVTAVNISLVNSLAGSYATVKVALLDNNGIVLGWQTNASAPYGAGVTNMSIAFNGSVSLTNNISTFNVIITEP